MTEFVADLPLKFITANGGNDTARSILAEWTRSNGAISSGLASYLGQTVLFDGDPDHVGSPEILFAGRGSLATEILGTEWADVPKKARGAFDSHYLDLIGEAYLRAARTGEPAHDFVVVRNGRMLLKYKRLILPMRADKGGRFLLCFSFDNESDVKKRGRGSAIEFLADHKQQSRVLNSLLAPEVSAR